MSWWRFEQRKDELEEEIQAHLKMDIQARMERGQSREEAQICARREFGNIGLVKDITHQLWRWGWLERFAQDLRFALRQLRKSPGFTVTVVLTLALGIGANTAIFSLTYALLLRSLPVEHPEQIVQLRLQSNDQDGVSDLSTGLYEAIKERQSVFSGMCGWQRYWFTGEQNGDGRNINSAKLTGDCLSTLGLHPVMGRLLTPEDDKPDAQAVVISYAWWKTRFHGKPNVIGEKLMLLDPFSQSRPFTVVGVLPSSFQSVLVGDAPSIFVPNGDKPENWNQTTFVFARLKDGVTPRQASEQVSPPFGTWTASLSSNARPEWLNGHPRLLVVPSRAGFSSLGMQYKKPLMLLQALVGILLLASCAYLGTLLSARSVTRRHEIALRAALGASRGRLIRQIFTESLLLAVAGSGAGVFFAWSASRFLLTFVESGRGPSTLAVGPSRDVLLFTLVVAVASVLLWGLLPAMRGSRVAFGTDLKGSSVSLLSGAQGRRFGRWLVPVQIALSLLIVVVAGLLSATLVRLLTQNNGYRMRGVVFADTDFSWAMGKDAATRLPSRIALYGTILDLLNHMPKIQSASLDMIHALAGGSYMNVFGNVRPPAHAKHELKSQSVMNFVGPRYFESLGSHLVRGREFNTSDARTSQPVCILTLAAERQFFPDNNAVGRILYRGDGKDPADALQVVGVVEDTRYFDLRSDAPSVVYMPYTQMGEVRPMEFVMKSDATDEAVASLQDVLHSMAPGVHVTDAVTIEHEVGQSLARERLLATLSNFFAILGLLLGAISLYGVLSYSVNCRTFEIGVRIALGASRGSVIRLILGEAMRLVIPGVVMGVGVCAAATRLVHSLLYETRPLDALTTTISVVAIVLTTLVASLLPAYRASGVDPMQALRAE